MDATPLEISRITPRLTPMCHVPESTLHAYASRFAISKSSPPPQIHHPRIRWMKLSRPSCRKERVRLSSPSLRELCSYSLRTPSSGVRRSRSSPRDMIALSLEVTVTNPTYIYIRNQCRRDMITLSLAMEVGLQAPTYIRNLCRGHSACRTILLEVEGGMISACGCGLGRLFAAIIVVAVTGRSTVAVLWRRGSNIANEPDLACCGPRSRTGCSARTRYHSIPLR
jgi:hypothetical protein